MPIVPPHLGQNTREAFAVTMGRYLESSLLAGDESPLLMTVALPRIQVMGSRQKSLQDGQLVSWDYLLVGSKDTAIASTYIKDIGEIGELIAGPLADSALAAARLGQLQLGHHKVAYSPVFVEASSARLLSLVFKAERGPSKVIDILDVHIVPEASLVIKTGLAQLFRRIDERLSSCASAENPFETP